MAEDKAELSLDDLKKLNKTEAAAEVARLAEVAAAEEDDTDDDDDLESDSDDDTSDDDTDDDDDKDDDKDPPAEAWMASEEDSDADDLKFTDGDAASIRKKYKARADKKDDENDQLRQRITELENKKPTVDAMKDKPKRDDFDSEDEFHEAVTDYKIDLRDNKNNAANASAAKKQALDLRDKQVSTDLDAHYVRAHALAAKSKITPETYQAADLKVRKALEVIFPKDGDAICDTLISITGEGSEKVFYHLGVNPTKLGKFIELLKKDRNGMAASSYLGRLNAELAQPAKRVSKAPAPGADVQGGSVGAGTDKNLQKQYKAAHKAGDVQKAFNIKKKAKAAKIDVKDW